MHSSSQTTTFSHRHARSPTPKALSGPGGTAHAMICLLDEIARFWNVDSSDSGIWLSSRATRVGEPDAQKQRAKLESFEGEGDEGRMVPC